MITGMARHPSTREQRWNGHFQLSTTNQGSIESWIQQTARWTPPEQGTLKINPGEAFMHDTCTGAAGAVLRSRLAVMAISWRHQLDG